MPDLGTTIRRRGLWDNPLAVRAYSLGRSLADRLGVQIVLKTYYSPIPDTRAVPAETWTIADPMRGVRFDLDTQLRFVEQELAALLRQFAPDEMIDAEHRYDVRNPSYPLPDARLLFAMVRRIRPRQIVELGSGQTSRVIAQACRMNTAEGHDCCFRAFDPFPAAVDAVLPGLTQLVRLSAQEVPEDVFAGLRSGDVLVVDTTHTVKLGSEVNRIVLRVLPLLAPGVIVHFHDIWLPYEYPRHLLEDYALYWGEQYLLQAFLSMNPGFEVLCAVYALCRDRAQPAAAAGLAVSGHSGQAFWIRRSER